ncbi:hypothetical protein [Kitasatospora kifunensis]|uniref:Phage major head subunit gpT-like protein n=1 Tax=Kitasatospora kifunensis TaxID=58351 RepID=A0A7W7R430_KITKI|nr:hypothetical protein [Kitasatospora kifunensis]MBB4925083.1 phage major head subunit gpT-like protein [Kitasatospora kifunensis]
MRNPLHKTLGRAAAISAGALMITGIAAPAYAHVYEGGDGGNTVSGHHPVFATGFHDNFAGTNHVHTASSGTGWATATATGGEGAGAVEIDGMHHH